jgi:asparagine N-glycosylation enzyme membrane subunit Stt3
MASGSSDRFGGPTQVGIIAGVLLACIGGLLLRVTALASVFPSDGSIILGVDDSYFHARRALYIFENFPAILEFDRYLAYPRGAAQPSPPLHDWLIAGTARLFGNDLRTFELVAAWIAPVLGALLPLSAFWIARSVASARVGLLASWLAAVIPAGIVLTSLGNCDHHATVALLVSLWVGASLRELRLSGLRLLVYGLVQATLIAALVFTWSGSLLYLAIGEGARLATVVLYRARQERFFAMAGSELLASAVVCAWLLSSAAPLGGDFTSQTLSWLHPVVLVSLALLTTALGVLERLRPVDRATMRLARSLLIGAGVALPSLLVPEIRDALATGIGFVGKSDLWSANNPEQQPLFQRLPGNLGVDPTIRFGYLVYAVPLLPLLVAYLGRRAAVELRDRWLLIFLWMLPLCALASSQIRYATDLAVLAAVGFALLLNEIRQGLLRRIGRMPAMAVTTALALGLLSPVYFHFAGRLTRTVTYLLGEGVADEQRRLRIGETHFRFAQMAREVTPETAGFLDATRAPEYGLLVPPGRGHVFTYVSRRPVPANNLGPYLDPELYQLAQSFYGVEPAAEALDLLEALELRYFVTALNTARKGSFAAAVHHFNDGSPLAPSRPSTGRIRLITQGPVNGRPFRMLGPAGRRVEIPAYKLFEVVEGAVLVGQAAANATITAEVTLATPLGRTRYRVSQQVDAAGRFRLRVPYPSDVPEAGSPHVHALGKWRVSHDGNRFEVDVSELDVAEGREIRVGAPLSRERGSATRES